MKTKAIKRCTSLLMALVMCVTAMLGLGVTAFAAGEQADVYMVAFPRDGDANYSNTWGHGDITYMNGWHSGSSRHLLVRAMNSLRGRLVSVLSPVFLWMLAIPLRTEARTSGTTILPLITLRLIPTPSS